MGKGLLIILAGYILSFTISHRGKLNNSTAMLNEVAETYEKHQNNYFTQNGIQVAIGELNKDTNWVGTTIANYNNSDAALKIEVTATGTKYVDNSCGLPPLSDYRKITSISNYSGYADTVKAIVYLGNAVIERPLTYAIFSEERLYFTGHPNHIEVWNNPHINANIHSNVRIMTSSYIYVEGFLSGSSPTYRDTVIPNSNPNHYRTGNWYIDSLRLPEVDFANFKTIATDYYSSTLNFTGNYNKAHPKKIVLGTLNNPSIWYIDGDFKVRKHTVYDGYGMIFVNGKVSFTHCSFQDEHIDTTNGVRLMVFSVGETRLGSCNVDAFVYSKQKVTAFFNRRSGQALRGQLVTTSIKMWSGMQLKYFPPKKEFIEQVFPYKRGLLYPKIVSYYD